MGFYDLLFRRQRTFSMQPSDSKMLQATRTAGDRPTCDCFSFYDNGEQPSQELPFHEAAQDTKGPAWKLLENLIEKAAAKRVREFAPGREMPLELWKQILTLPASIGRLTSVRKLYLYSSHLERVPPEIGNMTSLQELDLYTSYRLHWLPFEVTRCANLKRSRFSTRALYGNYKFRPPFPRLDVTGGPRLANCSICGGAISTASPAPVWISLRVGADILPLLVNVCSEGCISRLPAPANGHVNYPHRGGLNLLQPASDEMGSPIAARKSHIVK